MIYPGDFMYEAENWKDELARVEAERRLRAGLPRRAAPATVYRRLMASLGDRLVEMGCSLQERFYTESSPTICAG